MGFISQFATKGLLKPSSDGQALWQQVFGATDKEQGLSRPRLVNRPLTGPNKLAQERLLQALRSWAPGGWTDNRWEQGSGSQFVGAAYVAIHRISTMFGQSEFQVFDRDTKHPDGMTPTKTYEGEQLIKLLERPNTQDSWGKLCYRWSQQKRLTGMALTWMVPNMLENNHPDRERYEGAGTPYELYPIPTALAIPQPAINKEFPDGYWRIQPVYPYGPFSTYPSNTTAVGAAVPAQWMMRFLYPHPLLRYEGYSPLTGLKLEIDEFTMMSRSRHSKMRRSINPSAVLNLTDLEGQEGLPEPEIERIRAEWENNFQGPDNHGRLIVGHPGGTIDEWGRSPAEMDYTNSWEQVLSFILGGGFGITKPAAGMVEDSSYSTLFATLKQLHLVVLEPDADDLGADLTRQLAPFFGPHLIIKVRCKRVDDHDLVFEKINIGMGAGVLTKNQVLRMLDLPATEEPWGEEIAGQPPPPPPMEGEMGAEDGGLAEMLGPLAETNPGEMEVGAGDTTAEMGERGGNNGLSDPSEIENDRPRPGKLGRGAKGPNKSLNRKHLLNGKGKMIHG